MILYLALTVVLAGCEPGQLRCSGAGAVDGHCPLQDAASPVGREGEGEAGGAEEAAPNEGGDEGAGGSETGTAEGEGAEGDGEPTPPVDPGACGSALSGRQQPELSGGAGGPAGGYSDEIEIDGVTHPYEVIVPDCENSGATLGVAMALHDAAPRRDYLAFKWRDASASRGYIVVVPEARRTFNNQAVWGEYVAHNRQLLSALITKVEAEYNVARGDTIIAGLGAGATFAADLVTHEQGEFEFLFAVNSSLYDRIAEDWVKVFLLGGERESQALAERTPSDRFRYEFVGGLGPWYPGPSFPGEPDDTDATAVTNETAIDWFHAP